MRTLSGGLKFSEGHWPNAPSESAIELGLRIVDNDFLNAGDGDVTGFTKGFCIMLELPKTCVAQREQSFSGTSSFV